jgi:ribosomal protein S12 methylthiotransferase
MAKKVNIITLGCSKNLVDSENLLGELKYAGLEVMHESDAPADYVIINTCGFIGDAKEESIDTILSYAEARKTGQLEKLFVAGCLSQRYASSLEKEIHEVDGFYGTEDIPAILRDLGLHADIKHAAGRYLTTPSHYAYLKISEGCDRKCSFCAIPLIRGRHRSRSIDDLLKEAEYLAKAGVKELILIAQDLSWYGRDLYNEPRLPRLLDELTGVGGIEWIRLHYAYPASFPMEVLDLMRDKEKICRYLDIPLQHINDRILRSMRRGISTKETRSLVSQLRARVPGIALRTTMMVGYPGETDAEFNELLDFVRESRFERLGVFAYSAEDDTPAFALPDDVPFDVKQDRLESLLGLQQDISLEMNEARIGETCMVLVDRIEGAYAVGRTEKDSPEVDNEVLIRNTGLEEGEFCQVKIISASEFDLEGEKVRV